MKAIEVGPGNKPAPLGDDVTLVDVIHRKNVDFVLRWGVDSFPFANNEFDYFYASHVIEHVAWFAVPRALDEAARILKPGGTIELHTVDFGVLIEAYFDRSAKDTWTAGGKNKDGDFMTWINSRAISTGQYQSSVGDESFHKALFDYGYLKRLLQRSGFGDVRKTGKPKGPEKHGLINLGVTAICQI
jgi:predicted SAM-dependent methyltransferase